MAQTGRTYLTNDKATDAHYASLPSADMRSEVAVPLRLGKNVIGVLDVESERPEAFDVADVRTLESLADLLAAGLQASGLFAELRNRERMAEALRRVGAAVTASLELPSVLDTICAETRAAFDADGAIVWLLDHDSAMLRAAAAHGLVAEDLFGQTFSLADDTFISARAVHERRPVFANDVQHLPDGAPQLKQLTGAQAVLAAPIVKDDQPLGALTIVDAQRPQRFGVEDAAAAELLGAQIAVAIQNARLHTAVKEHAHELDALVTANAALLSTLDLYPLLHNVLQAAITAIPAAEKGAILLLDLATQHLQIRAAAGYTDPRIKTFAFADNQGYAAKAVREKRPLLIPDARAEPDIRYDGDVLEAREILSAIVAPLAQVSGRDQPIGAISLDATRRAAFTESDLRLLVAFANMAAVAIDNARLHTKVQTLAATDSLTNLANRRTFDFTLATEVARAERYGYSLSLIILDLDTFKEYNDTYGHPAGDERLKAIATLLDGHLREPDVAARYGGEEFGLILPHTRKAGALALAERIRATAEELCPAAPANGGPVPGYTLSLGVATFPDDALTPKDLLLAADNAELAAKRGGKNRVCDAEPLAAVKHAS